MTLVRRNNSLSGSWKAFFLPCLRNISLPSNLLQEAWLNHPCTGQRTVPINTHRDSIVVASVPALMPTPAWWRGWGRRCVFLGPSWLVYTLEAAGPSASMAVATRASYHCYLCCKTPSRAAPIVTLLSCCTTLQKSHCLSPCFTCHVFRPGSFLLGRTKGLPIHCGGGRSCGSKNSNYNERLGGSQNKIPSHTFLFRYNL